MNQNTIFIQYKKIEKKNKSIYLGKEVRNKRKKGSIFGVSCFTAALAMMYHCYGTIHLRRKIHLYISRFKKTESRIRSRMWSSSTPSLKIYAALLSIYVSPFSLPYVKFSITSVLLKVFLAFVLALEC